MKKLALTLTAAAFALGTMAIMASAQTPSAASFLSQLKNATPIVKEIACRGYTGGCGCGPGFVSACRNRCCRCVPCR